MPKDIIIKLFKIRKKILEGTVRENNIVSTKNNNLNECRFLIRNYLGQKGVDQCLKTAEKNELLTRTSISSENILQEQI